MRPFVPRSFPSPSRLGGSVAVAMLVLVAGDETQDGDNDVSGEVFGTTMNGEGGPVALLASPAVVTDGAQTSQHLASSLTLYAAGGLVWRR